MDKTSEISILEALHAGEGTAFSHIYDLYSRQLLFLMERMMGNKETAEDIVADSFIKVLKVPTPFESLQKLKSFLFTIAHNAGRDWIRAEKRHNKSHAEISYLYQEGEDNIEREMIRVEALQILYEEIEKLPAQYAEVIKRSFIEGESLSEIAGKMDMAYKTVQNVKAKAVQQLRMQILDRELPVITALLALEFLK